MQRHHAITGALCLLLAALVASPAQGNAITGFKGNLPHKLYGTYAPSGNCSREPRINVDDSGLAYSWHGTTTHSTYIETAVSMGGRGYRGISSWYYPFAQGYDDWGNLLLTFNPDERPGTLGLQPADSDWSKLRSLTPLQTALVQGSPYAKCGKPMTANAAAANHAFTAPQLKNGYRVNKPTAVQMTAIRGALGDKLKCQQPDPFCYSLYVADMNGDGRQDLVIDYWFYPTPCGAMDCKGGVLLATATGYASNPIDLPFHYPRILPATHHGMHDIKQGGSNKVWQWNGKAYR